MPNGLHADRLAHASRPTLLRALPRRYEPESLRVERQEWARVTSNEGFSLPVGA